MLPGPAVPGCCLTSFHFRWGKISTRTVHEIWTKGRGGVKKSEIVADVIYGSSLTAVTLIADHCNLLIKNKAILTLRNATLLRSFNLAICYSAVPTAILAMMVSKSRVTIGILFKANHL